MESDEAAEALRAKTELARRHAEAVREQARIQRGRAIAQREAEEEAVARARQALPPLDAPLHCAHCGATWHPEAVAEATRRQPHCLLCGRPLTPLP